MFCKEENFCPYNSWLDNSVVKFERLVICVQERLQNEIARSAAAFGFHCIVNILFNSFLSEMYNSIFNNW
jgi:hypothetical protein